MTQGTYGDQSNYDRNEMFAIGAAAGALIATAIQEMLERRRKTPLERASERAAAIVSEGSQKISGLGETAAEYVSDISEQSRKAARKQAKKARKQAGALKEVAAGALSAVASSTLVEQARERGEDGWLDGDRKSGGWFRKGASASNGAQKAAAPAAKQARAWWRSASDTAAESIEAARESKVADKASETGDSARSILESLSQSLLQYLESARETVSDAELGTKARGVASTARERIEDARIGDKARTYATTASETLKDVAETARERLADADLGDKAREYAGVAAETAKDYSAKAGKAAKVSADKLGASASYVAESTAEGARDLRKGVKKQVKRTRRRINWGLRAFIVGLVVGLLAAPQSGQRTRDMVQGFIENMLDIFLPDEQSGPGSAA